MKSDERPALVLLLILGAVFIVILLFGSLRYGASLLFHQILSQFFVIIILAVPLGFGYIWFRDYLNRSMVIEPPPPFSKLTISIPAQD
jgi:hypothetical protein